MTDDVAHDLPLALDDGEVRRLVRLLADALAPDDGRAAKIGRLMAGLGDWVGVDGWYWLRTRIHPATGAPENIDFLYGGSLDERHLAIYGDRSLEVHGEPPENAAIKRLMAEGRDAFTVSRGQVVPDAVWANAANREFVRRMGHDGMMLSVRQLGLVDGGPVGSFVILFRRRDRPQFVPRDARLAHAILHECGPLHAAGLNLAVAADVAGLTPRQRIVLAMLIDGHSVRHTADALRLSPHTVNDHCKAIYRHFDVSSRPNCSAGS